MITITNEEFRKLAAYIKQRYGIHLKEEKKTLVAGRLTQVLMQHKFKNFSEYYNYVISDRSGRASMQLIDKISTNHTFFMRESKHFDFLRSEVLPYLKRTAADQRVRMWSAGCSSGEEPYTLAMIIQDYVKRERIRWDAKILATDVSRTALDKAVKGIYKNEAVAVLPAHWRKNYFRRYDNRHMIVTDDVKQDVVIRYFNLMDRVFPFQKKFHVIFCRNVMIYFDQQTKLDLVRKFYQALVPGGYLFIGHSESLDRDQTDFRFVKPAVYRKE